MANAQRRRARTAGAVVLRKYTWGPDVSGSFEGAGGIGGLLSCLDTQGTADPNDDKTYIYGHDVALAAGGSQGHAATSAT